MKQSLRLSPLALVVALLIPAVIVGYSSEFWSDKPYPKWSEKEVKRLLSDSPWAKSVTLRHTILKQTRRDFGTLSNIAGEGEGVSDPEVDYTIYLRTARPVREALVRSAQFEQKYDELDSDAKKSFDSKWEPFLANETSDKVIFQVKYYSNTADVDRQLASYWQTQTVDTLRDLVTMTGPGGSRVPPVGFWTAKGAGREFQIAFTRPAHTSDDSAISLDFRHPNVTGEPSTRIYVKYSLKEMTYRGKPTY